MFWLAAEGNQILTENVSGLFWGETSGEETLQTRITRTTTCPHWPLGASVRSAPNQLTDILMWTSAGHWRLRLLLRCLFFSQEVDSKLHVMPFTVNVLFSELLQEVRKNSGEHKASSSVFWIVDQQHHDWLSSLKQTPDVWAITGPRGQVLKC